MNRETILCVLIFITTTTSKFSLKTIIKGKPILKSEIKIRPRVIAGLDDIKEEFPFVVALSHDETDVVMFKGARQYRSCSGSLVSPQWVLTAARCITPQVTRVRYGDMTQLNTTATYAKVLKKFPFPSAIANKWITKNDIGLLSVEPVQVKTYGRISAVDYATMVGHPVKYGGLGMTFKDDMKPADIAKTIDEDQTRMLQVGEALIVRCEKYKDIFTGPSICLSPKCMNREQRIQEGDTGGPVMYFGKVAGVASSIFAKHNEFRFTPVAPYLDWLHKTMTTDQRKKI